MTKYVCRTTVAPVGTVYADASSAVCARIRACLFWRPEDAGTRAAGERKKSSGQVLVCVF
jgi:hypothetical protein